MCANELMLFQIMDILKDCDNMELELGAQEICQGDVTNEWKAMPGSYKGLFKEIIK